MKKEEEKSQPAEPNWADFAYVWFLRLTAVYCLFLGVAYWIRLIGLHDGDLWRFDLMPSEWKFAATSLAVLFPVAATGLWMMVSWGPVIWFAAAFTETLMYTVFSSTYGSRPMVAVTHILILILYIVFRVVIELEKRRVAKSPEISSH